MELKDIEISYKSEHIYNSVKEYFDYKLSISGEYFSQKLTMPLLFDYYEKNISDDFEIAKENQTGKIADFYETLSIMAWAMFQSWSKAIIKENIHFKSMSELPKETIISNFMANLDCVEGRALRDRVLRSSRGESVN